MPALFNYSGFVFVFVFSHIKMLFEYTILESLVESSLFLLDTVLIFIVM